MTGKKPAIPFERTAEGRRVALNDYLRIQRRAEEIASFMHNVEQLDGADELPFCDLARRSC